VCTGLVLTRSLSILVKDTEAVVQQEQDDITHAQIAGLTSRGPEKTFEEMLVAIRDSLSDLPSSDDGEYGEGEDDEETEHGKLSDDDEPGWVMGTITNTVHQCIESCGQKQMKLNEQTQPGWLNAADYFRERDKKYGTSRLRVAAVVETPTNDEAPARLPTTCGELMKSLDIVQGISQRPQGTSQPGGSHVRLGSVKPQSRLGIPSAEPAAEPDSSTLLKAKPVAAVSFWPSM